LKTRLLREARALAQLQHPGICEVYRVGEEAGRPFVAMRLIDGEEIDAALADASWRTIVAVMRDAADAVAAAHAVGLVHRDLKPPNILIETQASDGALRPVVIDFGLVHDRQQSTMLTEAGEVLGTPHYMAPEQVRGVRREIGPAADVWALGVTLAQLLAGGRALPFRGDTSFDVMRAILRDPPALPDVGPPGLQQVLRRCLAKSPIDRYPDAGALVADLDRVLNHQPVVRLTVRHRLMRTVRRLVRRPVTVVAVGLLMAALGLSVLLELRHRARLHDVQRYGQLGRDLSWTMRAEHMRPLHDLAPARARLRARVADLTAELAALPRGSTARGPLHYAIGEGYRTLGGSDDAQALRHLEAAWAAGFRSPDAAYALGATLERRHTSDWVSTSPALRTRIVRLLALGRNAQSVSPDYVEARLALYDQRFDDALRLAEQARRTVPWAHEVDRLIGDIHTAESLAVDTTMPASVDPLRASAARAYARAIARAPSDPESRIRACRLDAHWIFSWMLRPHPASNDYAARALAHYRQGQDACRAALRLDGTSAYALAQLGHLELQYADYLRWRHDADPVPRYGIALRQQLRAARMASHSAIVHAMLSELYMRFGLYEGDTATHAAQARDARPYIDLADVHSRMAIHLEPANVLYARDLAMVASQRAWTESLAGRDPTRSAHAAHRLQMASRRASDNVSARASRALGTFDLWRAVVHYDLGQGRPLQPGLRFMRRALEEAGTPLASTGWELWTWSLVHQYEAVETWGTERDPRNAFDQATRYLQRAQHLDPSQMVFLHNEVSVLEARIDTQWIFGTIDSAWLARQRSRLTALRARVSDAPARAVVDQTLWRLAAQQQAMDGDAEWSGVPDRTIVFASADDPVRRAELALWPGLAAAARNGDLDAAREWRTEIEQAARAAASASAPEAQQDRIRAMLHVIDAALADDVPVRASHVAEVERLADAIVRRNPWQRHEAQLLHLALASRALAPTGVRVTPPKG
ncbi:MAG: serine/threonine-protein kinase, partial [Acidobacteriota bacterium]